MIVSAIAAVAKNRVIGRANDLPWRLPTDQQYFKRMTLNHHVIMGRKTFEELGRPLPKRTNIVITRNPYFVVSNCLVVRTVEEALAIARANGEAEAFIIGGGQIYELSYQYWDRLYYTAVDTVIEDGDAFFPAFDRDEWVLVSEDPHAADEKNEYDYNFMVFERKKDYLPGNRI